MISIVFWKTRFVSQKSPDYDSKMQKSTLYSPFLNEATNYYNIFGGCRDFARRSTVRNDASRHSALRYWGSSKTTPRRSPEEKEKKNRKDEFKIKKVSISTKWNRKFHRTSDCSWSKFTASLRTCSRFFLLHALRLPAMKAAPRVHSWTQSRPDLS